MVWSERDMAGWNAGMHIPDINTTTIHHMDLNSPKESGRRSSSGALKTKKGLVGKADNQGHPGNQMILVSLLASKQLHVVWKKYEKYAVRMASYKLQPHKLLSF